MLLNGSTMFGLVLIMCLLKNGANGQDLPRPLNGVRLYFNSSEFDDFSKHSSGDLSMGQELWCQTSANDTGPVGVWYYPNGTVIDDNSTTALRVMSANGQIGLYVMGTFTDQGLYSCVIPDENNISKTLVAAVYTDTEFNRAVAPNLTVPDFELLSSRDVDPPIFAINFTANERPPTEIVCYLNATLLDTMVYSYSRIVVSPLVPISVNVTVTFKTREAGNYSCEVTTNVFNVNLGKKPTTEPIIVAVPPTPVNVTSVRSSFETVTISWSTSSSSLEPSPNGYEVFYKIADDEETMIVDTRDTNATLDVEINHNYTVFVVAYYIDDTPSLPSAASEVIEIPQIISFDVSGPATTISYLSNTTLICEVTSFESAIDISSLQWFDPVGAEITANSNQFFIGSYINDDNTSASSDLEITNILLSQAGVYTCSVNLTIPADQVNRNELVLNLNEIHEIFIQVTEPSVSVTTSAITNGRIFDTGQVLFLCMVTLIGIDTNFIPNVTTSWFGPNGLVENDTNSIIDNQQLLEMQSDFNFYITLLINNLNITNDNNTTYTCSVSVGASMEFPRYEYIEPNSAADSSSPLSIEEFPDIDVLITIVGVPIIGEDIQLKCNITINDEDLLDNVTLGWLYNGDLFNDVTLVEQDDDYVAALTINSIDRINNGNYTCFGGLMLNGVQEMSTDSETLILVAVGNPSVNITSTGSSLADSSNYSLICTVLVDKGVPDVVWLDSNGSVIIDSTETLLSLVNGLVNILELQFATLEYSLAGEYTCQASLVLDIGDFDSSEIYVVNVEIPTPDVTIELSNSLAVPYEATQQMLTCTVSPISPLPNPLFIDIQWSMDNKPLDTDGVRLNLSTVDEYISTLSFSPAGIFDSGEYRCLVVISTNNPNIVNATESTTIDLVVQELPNPLIIFNASSTPFIGEELTLTCHIDTIDNLNNVNITSSIIIRDDSVTSIESLGDATVEFTYNPLMASSVGNYSCVTIITQLAINLNLSFNEEFVVSGIIPEPTITLSTDSIQNDALLEGTCFAITCSTIINQSVDSEYNITINWVLNNDQNLSNTSKYSILPVTEVSSNMFENTLQMNEIDLTDDNFSYTCIVSTVSDNEFLIDSTSNKSVVLGVTEFTSNDLGVSIVVVEPPQVVPIIAGETISLNCSVAVPVGFVSPPNNITFTYDVNGMESISANHTNAIQSSIASNSETVYSTTLTITSSKTSDARVYYCIAEFFKFAIMAVGNVSVSIQIPPPSMNITISPNSPIYESTRVNVTCIANLTYAVDTDIIPSFSWIYSSENDINGNNHVLFIDTAQISVNNAFQSILEFNPVDNGEMSIHSGNYTCQVLLSSNDVLVLEVVQNETLKIVVEDVMITSSSLVPSVMVSVYATHQATPSLTNNSISNTALIMIMLAAIATVITISVIIIIVFGLLIRRKHNKEMFIVRNRSFLNHNSNPGLILKDGIHAHFDNNRDKSFKRATIKSVHSRELSDIVIRGSDITPIDLIGQGEFGIVYRAVLSNEDEIPTTVAIKTLKGTFSENDIRGIVEEILKMKEFDHFNVVSLIGVCLDLYLYTEAPCIVMPYMSEGSLLSYLKRERPRLNIAENASVDDELVNNVTKQLLSMCLQVANGMEYLSKKKFVHRDLAARNCMMSEDGVIKVADFGLTEDVYASNYFRLNIDNPSQKNQIKLPIKWMALESIHDGLFSEKTDVWSYGIICWEVFSLAKVPYPGLSPKEVVDFLDSGQRLDQPKNPACTGNIFAFIASCWNEKPDDRITFTRIVSSVNELIKPFAGYMELKQLAGKENYETNC